MYNWSVDEEQLKKDEEQYRIWKIEQTVNFGLAGEKIDEKLLKKYWLKLNIEPARRKFIGLLIDEK